ncbi:MAG TPA: inositol monophosphatase family protein [Corynebacteriales bacterium]|nr:inositol monophosphatase family protein [Mycobacteriales bacterium]
MVSKTFENVELASQLARNAGRIAHRMRNEGLTISQKSSISDVVTEADKAAEEYVVTTLHEQRPNDAILGEEGTTRTGTSGTRWTIDPVDGTYNFSRNFEYWCSAVAFTENDPTTDTALTGRELHLSGSDNVTVGAVYQPCEDTLWVGGKNYPTTRDGVTLPQFGDENRVTPKDLSSACLNTYLHPRFTSDPEGPINDIHAAWLRVVKSVATYRMMGSASVDLASVAEGDTDLWIQHRLPDWDRLPGAALVWGVGGKVVDVDSAGEIWTVAGAPHLVDEAAELLVGN